LHQVLPMIDDAPLRLVRRSCQVCEWDGIQVEEPDADPDCPWCHGPTRIVDVIQTELAVVGRSTGGKNPYAAALGKLGGEKGGRARAQSLSKKRRSEIARKAAKARWKKR
jgi:hypothetical protein